MVRVGKKRASHISVTNAHTDVTFDDDDTEINTELKQLKVSAQEEFDEFLKSSDSPQVRFKVMSAYLNQGRVYFLDEQYAEVLIGYIVALDFTGLQKGFNKVPSKALESDVVRKVWAIAQHLVKNACANENSLTNGEGRINGTNGHNQDVPKPMSPLFSVGFQQSHFGSFGSGFGLGIQPYTGGFPRCGGFGGFGTRSDYNEDGATTTFGRNVPATWGSRLFEGFAGSGLGGFPETIGGFGICGGFGSSGFGSSYLIDFSIPDSANLGQALAVARTIQFESSLLNGYKQEAINRLLGIQIKRIVAKCSGRHEIGIKELAAALGYSECGGELQTMVAELKEQFGWIPGTGGGLVITSDILDQLFRDQLNACINENYGIGKLI